MCCEDGVLVLNASHTRPEAEVNFFFLSMIIIFHSTKSVVFRLVMCIVPKARVLANGAGYFVGRKSSMFKGTETRTRGRDPGSEGFLPCQ